MQGVDKVQNIVYRPSKVAQIDQEGENDTDCDTGPTAKNGKRTGKCDQQVGKIIGHIVEGTDDPREKLCAIGCGSVAGIGFIETVNGILLMIEKLDQLFTRNIFFNLGVQAAQFLLLNREGFWVMRAAVRE